VEELKERLSFPVGFGQQDYWVGQPLYPEDLAALAYKDRKAAVISAINNLGPDLATETPLPPDPEFESEVESWITQTGVVFEDAVFFRTLATLAEASEETRIVCDRAPILGTDPRSHWLARLAERLATKTHKEHK